MSEPIKIPQHIDELPYLLFWRIDELIPLLIATAGGILIDQVTMCLGIAIVLNQYNKRFREKRQIRVQI